MDAKTFVKHWKEEKESLVREYLNHNSESEVALKIKEMELSSEQLVQLRDIVDEILSDTFYTLLLGLDGAASIGGLQEEFIIYDEEGSLVASGGELEAEAYEHFMELS